MDFEFGPGFDDDLGDEFISVEGEAAPPARKAPAKKKASKKAMKQMEDLYAACVNPLVDKKDVISISDDCSGIHSPKVGDVDEDKPHLPAIHEDEFGDDDDEDDGEDMLDEGLDVGEDFPTTPAAAPAAHPQSGPTQASPVHGYVPVPQPHMQPHIQVMQTNEEVEFQERAILLDDYDTLCDRGIVDTRDPHHFSKMQALPLPLLRSEVYRLKHKWHSKSQVRLYKRYLITAAKFVDYHSGRIRQLTFGALRLQGFSDQVITSIQDNDFDEAFTGIYHQISKRRMNNPWGSLSLHLLLCGSNAQLNNMGSGSDDSLQRGRPARPVNDVINAVTAIGSLMGGGGGGESRGGKNGRGLHSKSNHQVETGRSAFRSHQTPQMNPEPAHSAAFSPEQGTREEVEDDRASQADITQSLKNISERYKKKKGQQS